jgi:uncharacterized protein YhjY with autotransporter beta-barrel domain/predicted secreted protein
LAILLLALVFPQHAMAQSAACSALNASFGNGAPITLAPPSGSNADRQAEFGPLAGTAPFDIGETISWSAQSFGPGDTTGNGGYTASLGIGTNNRTPVDLYNDGGNFTQSGSFDIQAIDDGYVSVYAVVENLHPLGAPQNPPSSLTFSVSCAASAAPAITGQPANATVVAGGNTSFSVTATNATGYQWQVDTGSGFTNVTDGGVHSGATTATLTVTGATAAMNGYLYRVLVSGNAPPDATSNAASLTVRTPPAITAQPAPATVVAGGNTSFSVTATDATSYQWQVNTGSGFSIVANGGVYSGAMTATLTITGATAAMNGYSYRVIAFGATPPSAISNAATLVVQSPPTITGISPTSGPVGGGTGVTITGTDFTVPTFVTFGGVPTPAVIHSPTTITAMTQGGPAGAVDVVVTTPTGSAMMTGGFTYEAPVSTVTSVSVPANGYYRTNQILTFLVHFNENVAVDTSGGTPSLPVTIGAVTRQATYVTSNANVLVFSYQVVAGDEDFDGIQVGSSIAANGGTITNIGGTAANLALANVGSTSNVFVYTLEPVVVSTQVVGTPPTNATSVVFEVVFSEAVVGLVLDDLQLTTTGTAAATLANLQTVNNIRYTVAANGITGAGTLRVDVAANAVTNIADAGNPAYTGGAPWVVAPLPAPAITGHPANATVAAGGNATFSVTATNATGYQWEMDDGSGLGYFILIDDGTFSGVATATLTITGVTGEMDGYRFRAVAIGATEPSANSNAATLTVLSMPGFIGISPTNGPSAGGTNVTITGTSFVVPISVSLGGTPATNVVVHSPTTLTAVTPGGAPGAVDVVVATTAGSVTRPGGFTYDAPVPPAVTSVSVPANGYYRTNDVLSFTVNFNENVTVDTSGGTPSLPVTIGAITRQATYVAGSGTSALLFSYDVVAGDQDLNGIHIGPAVEANGGTVASSGGTMANLTLVNVGNTNNVLVYTLEPVVVSTQVVGTPPSNATSVVFEVVFSEAVTGLALGDLQLTTTGTATATLAGLQTTDNITYTVTADGITGAGTLRVDVAANAATNIAGAGNPAYTGGAPWVVASANADLLQLQTSAGALTPAFDPAISDYDVTVDNATQSVALTPTSAEPNATITVDGQVVASGVASQAIALAVGATPIPVVVTAQDSVTTRTYTVTVERTGPVPTVASRTVEIIAGQTAIVDLTEGATGGPFTAASVVGISDGSAGTTRIEQDGQAYHLVFEASPVYSGASNVRYTLSNTVGQSAPGTITFSVLARPDPSQDAEVIGLLTAQADAAKRFAHVQTQNFNRRLEQLHDEGERRSNSLDVRLGYVPEHPDGRAMREVIDQSHDAITGNRAGGGTADLLGYGPDGTGDGSGALSAAESLSSAPPADQGGMDLGDYAVWSGGFINFGERNGTIDLDYTNVGVSGGIDYRFSSQFIGGIGIGFGRDRADIGENGTQSTANAYSAAVYGSYKPFENVFVDGLIGASWLDFDSTRYITSTGDFAIGSRSGHQLFGALTAAYEFRDETWLVSPYGRVEFSRSWLDGFTEDGGGMFALRYGDQSIDTLSGVIGLRAEYTYLTEWGSLTPGVRIEYTHDFAGSSRAGLGYADLDGLPYAFEVEPTGQSYTTLGLSLDAALPHDWSLGLDYRTAFGRDQQDHAVGLQIGKRF